MCTRGGSDCETFHGSLTHINTHRHTHKQTGLKAQLVTRSPIHMSGLEQLWEMTKSLCGNVTAFHATSHSKDTGRRDIHGNTSWSFGGIDFKQQFHSPRGFIPPFLSKLQNPSNKFADGRKRRSLIFFSLNISSYMWLRSWRPCKTPCFLWEKGKASPGFNLCLVN